MKINPLGANPTKWSNTFKQFVGKLPTNRLSVFDHFVGLALKGISTSKQSRSVTEDFCIMILAAVILRVNKE